VIQNWKHCHLYTKTKMFRVWGLGSDRRSHSMEVFRESAQIKKHWLRFDQPKVGWTNSIRVASIRKTLENFIFGYCKQLDQGLRNSVYNMIYAHMIWLWSLVSPTSLWPLLQMFGFFCSDLRIDQALQNESWLFGTIKWMAQPIRLQIYDYLVRKTYLSYTVLFMF
jgi:hypothetical protein